VNRKLGVPLAGRCCGAAQLEGLRSRDLLEAGAAFDDFDPGFRRDAAEDLGGGGAPASRQRGMRAPMAARLVFVPTRRSDSSSRRGGVLEERVVLLVAQERAAEARELNS
jgi:hypothetical protein